MEQTSGNTMTCASFARKHDVSRTTVQRWRDAGYVVMTGNRVDIARSEKLLAERPAVDRGGVAKGPTDVFRDGELWK